MRTCLFAALLALCACASGNTSPPTPLPTLTETVPIDPTHPDRDQVGDLHYLGGIEIRSPDKRVGGFSSLKRQSGRLYAIVDEGDWAIIDPVEQNGRLVGAKVSQMGDLHDANGAVIEGSDKADAESLAPHRGGWLVGFEHRHRIDWYKSLAGRSQPSGLDPIEMFGNLAPNNGVETLATRDGRIFVCAERLPAEGAANCMIVGPHGREPVSIPPPGDGLDPKNAFPVDADWAADGTLYILIRSWSGGTDLRSAIVRRSPDGRLRTLAAFVKPLTVDNYEGLALRQEGGRTFLYMISDDNFKAYNEPAKPETWQRTLLMKFEVTG
jgi:hypothetical protein